MGRTAATFIQRSNGSVSVVAIGNPRVKLGSSSEGSRRSTVSFGRDYIIALASGPINYKGGLIVAPPNNFADNELIPYS